MTQKPNKALEPTPTSVTSPAAQEPRQPQAWLIFDVRQKMAFTLQAFIGDLAVVRSIAPAGVTVIALPQSKGLFPLTEKVRDAHEISFLPLTDEGVDEVPEAIVALAASAKKVAYVEAEFFGGDGTQAAAIWEEGSLIFGPVIADDAINQALRQILVSKQECFDEFEALNLSRHRDTEDWR